MVECFPHKVLRIYSLLSLSLFVSLCFSLYLQPAKSNCVSRLDAGRTKDIPELRILQDITAAHGVVTELADHEVVVGKDILVTDEYTCIWGRCLQFMQDPTDGTQIQVKVANICKTLVSKARASLRDKDFGWPTNSSSWYVLKYFHVLPVREDLVQKACSSSPSSSSAPPASSASHRAKRRKI